MNKRFFTLLFALATLIASVNAQILFEVSGNGLAKPSYIFGTHHFAPLSIVDSVPSVKRALNEVETVVGEIDMLSLNPIQMAQTMQPYMMASPDSTLTKLLSPAEMAEADSLFNQATGMQLQMFNTMRPIVPQLVVVALNASKISGVDVQNEQLDKWFQQQAKEKGKSVEGLETVEQQAVILYTYTPLELQAKNLLQVLRNPDEGVEDTRALTEAYMSRDLNRLAALSNSQIENSDDKNFAEMLIVNRNNDWLSKMPAMMQRGQTLFAVGALHLPEEHGIIEGLRRLGYTVTPIVE